MKLNTKSYSMARSYVIAIEGDEQYRTENRGQAKAFYNLVDETFECEVDGLKKQLIQVDENGWDSKILLEDVIHCPQKEEIQEKQDQDEDLDEEQPIRHGFRR